MKIGMLTGLWYVAESATLIESLHRVASLGFRYIDLHGVFHGGPAHLTLQARQDVKVELASLGLIPRNYVLHAPYNVPSASEAELEQDFIYLQEGINLALDWNINQLMLNAGQWSYGVTRSEAWTKSVRFLKRLCDYAAPRGLYIAQEPEPYIWYLVNDISSCLRMLADVDRQNFTVLIDLGHMGLARENPAELALIKDVIIHAHFSEHIANCHTNQIVGTGITPTADYLEMLRYLNIDQLVSRFGYQDLVVSFELGVPGDHINAPDEWVRKSIEHIQQIAPYLSIS